MTQRAAIFSAKFENINVFASTLKCVSFTDKVNVQITTGGMRVVAEEGKYVQMTSFLKREVFADFVVNFDSDEDRITFKIPIKEVVDFLKHFCTPSGGHHDGKSFGAGLIGSNTKTTIAQQGSLSTLHLKYEDVGCPFCLRLDEVGTYTELELRIEEHDTIMELGVDPVAHIIFKSDIMKDIFGELSSNAPDSLKFKIFPSPNGKVQIVGNTSYGKMKVIIPENSLDIIESFKCRSLVEWTYKFHSIQVSLTPLNWSDKVSMKIGSNGTLCLSFVTPLEQYMEYFGIPTTEEELPPPLDPAELGQDLV